MSKITPEGGVKAFLRKFGTPTQTLNTCMSMGISINRAQISKWKIEDQMPSHIYESLRLLVVEETFTQIGSGYIEFYLDGEPLGQFYLHRRITAVIRKKRK